MTRPPRRSPAFSIVELLVVILITTVLLGILLVALGAARTAAKKSSTLATMSSFAAACETFRLEHGFYPGVVPETILAFHNHQLIHGVAGTNFSSTENALLHLLGGFALEDEMDPAAWNALDNGSGWTMFEFLRPEGGPFRVKVNYDKIGDGPVIAGKSYPPYMEIGKDVRIADFDQWPWESGGGGEDWGGGSSPQLPDLVDAWGTPILYIRQARSTGRLCWDAHEYNVGVPQFYVDNLWAYTRSRTQTWFDPCSDGDGSGSLLNSTYFNGDGGGHDPADTRRTLAVIIRHHAVSGADPLDFLVPGTARGAFILISAGADGIYFSSIDGPGAPDRPIGSPGCGGYESFSVEEFLEDAPDTITSFDDIVHYGGSL